MEIPKYYHDVFNKPIAKLYDITLPLMMFGQEKRVKKEILKYLPKDPKNILDLACGTGTLALEIKKNYKNASVYGVDLSKIMLGKALQKARKNKLDINFSLQNIEKTNFKSNSFDVITISLALHELPLEIIENVIKETYRLLKKNGVFIILDLHKPKKGIVGKLFLYFIKKTEPYGMDFINQDLVKLFKKFKLVQRKTYLKDTLQMISFRK